jgi:ORF6N domain-containing protein
MAGAEIRTISGQIRWLRDTQVILDSGLAAIYGVTTKQLNQQVKRNLGRFPSDFMFRLDQSEWEAMRSQIVTTSKSRRRLDNPPLAFTEHGCLMVANVLRVPRAIEISVLVVRAFVQMRSGFDGQATLAARVEKLGRELEKQGRALTTHEVAILKLLAEIRRLAKFPEKSGRPIGFTADLDDRK